MTIKTEYDPKPIPIRRLDWSAWIDELDEDSPVGHGLTEEEAIKDLKTQLDYYEINA